MGNVRMEAADRADIDMQGMGGARDPEGRVNQWNSSEQGLHGICLDLQSQQNRIKNHRFTPPVGPFTETHSRALLTRAELTPALC